MMLQNQLLTYMQCEQGGHKIYSNKCSRPFLLGTSNKNTVFQVPILPKNSIYSAHCPHMTSVPYTEIYLIYDMQANWNSRSVHVRQVSTIVRCSNWHVPLYTRNITDIKMGMLSVCLLGLVYNKEIMWCNHVGVRWRVKDAKGVKQRQTASTGFKL